MKITIPRDKWLRGTGIVPFGQGDCFCVFGHIFLHFGVPPSCLHNNNSGCISARMEIPKELRPFVKSYSNEIWDIQFDRTTPAIKENDSPEVSDTEREAFLILY